MLYQLAGVDFSGTDDAADLALYVDACTAAGLRTVGTGAGGLPMGPTGVPLAPLGHAPYADNCEASD